MPANASIAIELDGRRFRGVWATREGAAVRLGGRLVETLPADVEATDASAVGRWLRTQLKAAGCPRAGVTVVIPRERVVLKRLSMPTVDTDELTEMVRLAMLRETPFEGGDAVVDYVPVGQKEANTTVMAVAVPVSLLDHLRAVMREARWPLSRVTLRAMGIATLLRSIGRESSETLLAVELAGGLAEFCVVEGDSIRFARSAEVFGTDSESTAAALVTETRRSWMSFRFAETGGDVDAVALLGDPGVMEKATERIEQMIQVPSQVLRQHPLVHSGELNEQEVHAVWSLAGLLLEPVLGRETIDFLHPRRVVPTSERVRRPAMLAAGLIVLTALGFWTYAKRDLAELAAEVASLEMRRTELRPADNRLGRENARMRHVNLWIETRAEWLEHLRALEELLPDPSEVVLDGWSGSIAFRGVQYDRRTREWSAPRRIGIAVDGEAVSRMQADQVRERLVTLPWYDTSSTGADGAGGRRHSYRFSYRLSSGEAAPPDLAEEANDDGDAAHSDASGENAEASE